jgi:hypothetical protein
MDEDDILRQKMAAIHILLSLLRPAAAAEEAAFWWDGLTRGRLLRPPSVQ